MSKLKASDVIEIDDAFLDEVADRIAERSKPDKDYYTPTEISEMIHLKVETVRAHIRQDKLKATWFGRGWSVSKEHLENYLSGTKKTK